MKKIDMLATCLILLSYRAYGMNVDREVRDLLRKKIDEGGYPPSIRIILKKLKASKLPKEEEWAKAAYELKAKGKSLTSTSEEWHIVQATSNLLSQTKTRQAVTKIQQNARRITQRDLYQLLLQAAKDVAG